MRFALLLLIATALGAADVRQLGPTDELPFCRVVVSGSDNGKPVTLAHDGWWSPNTHQLFPLNVPSADLGQEYTIDAESVVSVTPAAAQPGKMPSAWRKQVNAFIAKHHPKLPDATVPAAATAAK